MAAVLADTGLVDEIVEGLGWPDIEETGDTLETNAALKARAVVEATGLPAIGDDTGLEVAALDGAPGVYSSRFAGPNATYDDNVARLLGLMDEVEDRSARFRTVVVLALPDGSEIAAEGSIEGWITTERRGNGGFGYDPVFEVEGQTLAEMGIEAKNRLSHRSRALQELARTFGRGE